MARIILTLLALLALTLAGTGHATEKADARAVVQGFASEGDLSRGTVVQQTLRILAGQWVREWVGIEGDRLPSGFGTFVEVATDPALRLDVHDDGATLGYTFRF
ncbi:hypothetical protein AAIA72_07810 [Hahella sp. SMD15-11]|uniref:Uncharacterized protein n=1 Tax=Thermohahella caldifontis TaxID=3142973 RepID=A0AB39V0Y0_9GAMM